MTRVRRLGCTAISTTLLLCLVAPRARAQSPAPRLPESEPAGRVAGRVVAEVLMGSGLATVGFLGGPKLAGAACSGCMSAAGFAGASAAFPLGVYWGGRLVHGRGSFWLTVAAPWLVSATTFAALARDDDYDGRPALQIGAVGGAIAAPLAIALFELSSAVVRASAPRTGAASRVDVAIGPRGDGVGLVVSYQQ